MSEIVSNLVKTCCMLTTLTKRDQTWPNLTLDQTGSNYNFGKTYCWFKFDQTLIKFDQTCSSLIKLDQIGSNLFKLDQIGLNLVQIDQTCSTLFKPDQTGSNWIKLDQTGSNWIKLVQTCLTWSLQTWSWKTWSWQTLSLQTWSIQIFFCHGLDKHGHKGNCSQFGIDFQSCFTYSCLLTKVALIGLFQGH